MLCCFSWLLPLAVVITIALDVLVVESFTSSSQLSGKKNSASPRIETDCFHLHERPTAVAAATPRREEIRYIAGRRALLLHPTTSSKQPVDHPPLIILGGMAQSIASWEFHLPHFAKDRSVLIYECLGQGPLPPEEICSKANVDTYYADVSLERQGSDFWNVVDEAFENDGKVDVVGFSFGGRVAMAAAVSQPNRIRRLHLTGVAAERDEYANVLLASWKEMLGANDADIMNEKENDETNNSRLRAFAWSIILATYSEQFLASVGAARLHTWVDGVCKFNTQSGLKAILLQTHGGEGQWTPASMAEEMKGFVESYKLVVGSNDKMASPDQVLRLAQLLGTQDESKQDNCCRVVENCGHAVPFEAMRLWREDVIKYLT
ncbi:alpha/beta hydrolase family protein [Skeletonema marinoi]|uniref:Alpha/beta hydrolase family protein n=1 Tax=Skeletonema marinoi TaxID=267567 RepID=A0AAD8YIX1_9STRA|nr:alpha/beta hydrolase family protein [Skeletonema marinoi]